MSEDENRRFQLLLKEYLTNEELLDLIHIDVKHPYILTRLSNFYHRERKKEAIKDGLISRYAVEAFLKSFKLISLTASAASLGMSKKSLGSVIGMLDAKDIIIHNTKDYPDDLLSSTIIKEIHKYFESTIHVIFKNHTSYCQKLHKAIKDELGISVEPVFCKTSEVLKDPESLYSSYLCSVSQEPVSLKYSVQMNFGKPPYLFPDICSKYFLYRNQGELNNFVLGGIKHFEEFQNV